MATTPITAKLVDSMRQTDELADVVIASDSRDRKEVPWYIRLRIWLFCLMFLGMAECVARVAFDGTLCLREERFDNFPNPAALDAFVGQIKRDRAFRVVVLGDSVVVGPSLLAKDETITAYLEAALKRKYPGRDIHTWNLGIAGARSTDLYCMLLKVLEAEPDLVVIENNFMMYTLDIRLHPVECPWLAYSLPKVPDPIQPLLSPLEYKRKIDDECTWFVERNFRLFGMRQAINGLLFGVQPRIPYGSPNPAVMLTTRIGQTLGKLPMEPWNVRGLTSENFRSMYANPVRYNSLNGRFYRIMIEELRRRKVPAFFYMTPQNPAMMNDYFPAAVYAENRKVAASFMLAPDFPSADYATMLPDNLFYDNDHLLPAGNKEIAGRMADDLAPLMQHVLSAKDRRRLPEVAAIIPKLNRLSSRQSH